MFPPFPKKHATGVTADRRLPCGGATWPRIGRSLEGALVLPGRAIWFMGRQSSHRSCSKNKHPPPLPMRQDLSPPGQTRPWRWGFALEPAGGFMHRPRTCVSPMPSQQAAAAVRPLSDWGSGSSPSVAHCPRLRVPVPLDATLPHCPSAREAFLVAPGPWLAPHVFRPRVTASLHRTCSD